MVGGGGADLLAEAAGLLEGRGPDPHDVGVLCGDREGGVAVPAHHHDGVSLRRSGRDGRALHGEVHAVVVHVVQLVAVDEAPCRGVTDLGVVLPAVGVAERSEERRVGKECLSQCRSRWSPYH